MTTLPDPKRIAELRDIFLRPVYPFRPVEMREMLDCIEQLAAENAALKAELAKVKAQRDKMFKIIIRVADLEDTLQRIQLDIRGIRTGMENELPTLEDIQKIYRDAAMRSAEEGK